MGHQTGGSGRQGERAESRASYGPTTNVLGIDMRILRNSSVVINAKDPRQLELDSRSGFPIANIFSGGPINGLHIYLGTQANPAHEVHIHALNAQRTDITVVSPRTESSQSELLYSWQPMREGITEQGAFIGDLLSTLDHNIAQQLASLSRPSMGNGGAVTTHPAFDHVFNTYHTIVRASEAIFYPSANHQPFVVDGFVPQIGLIDFRRATQAGEAQKIMPPHIMAYYDNATKSLRLDIPATEQGLEAQLTVTNEGKVLMSSRLRGRQSYTPNLDPQIARLYIAQLCESIHEYDLQPSFMNPVPGQEIDPHAAVTMRQTVKEMQHLLFKGLAGIPPYTFGAKS